MAVVVKPYCLLPPDGFQSPLPLLLRKPDPATKTRPNTPDFSAGHVRSLIPSNGHRCHEAAQHE